MTVTAKTLLQAAQLPSSETAQYTVPSNTRAIIDKMTVTNPTGGAVTFTIKLVAAGGTAATTNTVISAQSVAAGTAYLCPEVVGHILNPSDFISALASAAASLVLRISGREVS